MDTNANTESTKFALKEAFHQGFPEIINIPITESAIYSTIKVFMNKNSSSYDGISNKIKKGVCDSY